MTTRIYKTEKFIPKIGNPVFQVHEEAEVGSQVLRLDPRNPTAEEMADADEAFAAAQQSVIATLRAEKTELEEKVDKLGAEKQNLVVQVEALNSQIESLETQLDAFLNPPGPDVTTREGVKLYLAQKRYEKEIAGFTVGGQLISTNRDELAHWFARFFDAFNHLQGNTSASGGIYPYKPRGGITVVNLTAEQAVRAYQCLAWYVNACIATEGELIEAIDAAQLSQLVDVKETIDTIATWPQRSFEWLPG